MSRLTASLAMAVLLALAGAAQAGTINVIDFSGTPHDNGGTDFSLGYKFTTIEDVWVTDLGYFNSGKDGLNVSHDVGLWRDDGTLLASTTVVGTDVLDGWFRFAAINAVHLAAGESFVVGGMSGTNSNDRYVWNVTNMTVAPQIQFDEHRYLLSNVLAMPTSNATTVGEFNGYFGASFRISDVTSSVPLPSAAWAGLGLLCGIGIVARLRMRRSATLV